MRECGRVGAVLLLLAAIQAMAVAQQPPATHQQADGHWSAWSAPTDTGDTRVHVIEAGDTLWDLAREFYGDPYRWPELWELNRYIEDSHWIYPGDPLVIDSLAAPVDQIAAMEEPGGQTASDDSMEDELGDGLRLNRDRPVPEPLGSENDIFCSGFIGEPDRRFERRIVGSEYENLSPRMAGHRTAVQGRFGTVDTVKIGLTAGDIVYLDGGSEGGLLPGTLYTVISPKEEVFHPDTGASLGRFYKYSGRARVLSVQERTAIAEIVHSCDSIFVGAALDPFVEEAIPLARRARLRALNDPVSPEQLIGAPTIVRSVANVVSLGQGHVVFVDRGSAQDVVPGDIYTIYRANGPGMPPVVIGEVGILSVQPGSATARILESRYTVHLGDRLDLETR